MENHSAALPSGSVPGRTSSSNITPPELPRLDAEAFRRKLAGLTDPERRPESAGEKEAMKQDAIRFCSILAHLFGESLDRTTLWEKIGSALSTSLAKVSDDDLDRFATLCLEHIVAEDSKVAACEPLMHMLQAWETRTREWRHALLHYLATHRTAALVHARARWECVKKKEVEL